MLLLAVIIILLSTFEIIQLRKNKQRKEMVIFVCFAAVAFAFGIFYISNPYRNSLAYYVLAFFGFYE